MRDQTCFGYFVNVSFERECGDVSFKSTNDRAGLRAASLIGFLKLNVLASLLFPVCFEHGYDTFAVRFARGCVATQN